MTSVNSLSCSYVAAVSVPLLATVPPIDRVITSNSAPTTTAFFIEPVLLTCRPCSAPVSEPLLWVLRLALVPDLEVQARPRQRAGVPHRPDPRPLTPAPAPLPFVPATVGAWGLVLASVSQVIRVPYPF